MAPPDVLDDPWAAVQWGWDRFVNADGHIQPYMPPSSAGFYLSARDSFWPKTPRSVYVPPVKAHVPITLLVLVPAVAGRNERPRFIELPGLPRTAGGLIDAVEGAVGGKVAGLDQVALKLAKDGRLDDGGATGVVVWVLPTWQSDP